MYKHELILVPACAGATRISTTASGEFTCVGPIALIVEGSKGGKLTITDTATESNPDDIA